MYGIQNMRQTNLQGANTLKNKVPGNKSSRAIHSGTESSMDQKFHRTKYSIAPKLQLAKSTRILFELLLLRANWPGSKKARYLRQNDAYVYIIVQVLGEKIEIYRKQNHHTRTTGRSVRIPHHIWHNSCTGWIIQIRLGLRLDTAAPTK